MTDLGLDYIMELGHNQLVHLYMVTSCCTSDNAALSACPIKSKFLFLHNQQPICSPPKFQQEIHDIKEVMTPYDETLRITAHIAKVNCRIQFYEDVKKIKTKLNI